MRNSSLVGALFLLVLTHMVACKKTEDAMVVPLAELPHAAPLAKDATISNPAEVAPKISEAAHVFLAPPIMIPIEPPPEPRLLPLLCLPNDLYGHLCGGGSGGGGGGGQSGSDLCPDDPAKTAPGLCGCGVVDSPVDARPLGRSLPAAHCESHFHAHLMT